jgi:hypothetical protein
MEREQRLLHGVLDRGRIRVMKRVIAILGVGALMQAIRV